MTVEYMDYTFETWVQGVWWATFTVTAQNDHEAYMQAILKNSCITGLGCVGMALVLVDKRALPF